jgi:pimeloyl-ACP methyl ester carboxylesterase
MSSNLQHRRIAANGAVHHYVTAGEGRPLLLVHGFPQTWLQWRPIIDRLVGKFHIIAPDLRGLGGVPGPVDGYDKHSLAADMRAILAAECGEQPAIVCGHDMGAYVAFAYALNNRTEVEALVMVDAPPPGTSVMDQLMTNPRTWHIAFHSNADVAHMLIFGREREYIRYFIRSRIYNAGAISTEDIDLYAAAYSAPGALRAALEMYRALGQDRVLNLAAIEEKGKLQGPVTVVGCSMTSTPALLNTIAAEIATNALTVVIENSGHWIPEEQPERLAEIIVQAAGAG